LKIVFDTNIILDVLLERALLQFEEGE